MNMKKLMAIVVAAISMATFAKSIYFVSGGDFRECHIKYTLTTENDNEIVELTPTYLKTLAITSANMNYNHEWEMRFNGRMFSFLGTDCIRQGQPGELVDGSDVGATNIFPVCSTFAYPDTKIVKVYDVFHNIQTFKFQTNNVVTSIRADFEEYTTGKQIDFSVRQCPNVKEIYYSVPKDGATYLLQAYSFQQLPSLRHLEIRNGDKITNIGNHVFEGITSTNDVILPNLSYVGRESLNNIPNIHYVSIPSAKSLGEACLCNASITTDRTKQNGFGLYKMRISDKLTTIGRNCFYGMENLNTIEYVTSEQDWIGKWNSSILADVIGTIGLVDGKDDEAILTPKTGTDSYYTGSRRIGSNTDIQVKVVLVK